MASGQNSLPTPAGLTKDSRYRELTAQVEAVLSEETDPLVWMASLSCLIRQQMGFFWVGFYLAHGRELRIGPYQGTLGCLRIPFERGVCGAAARTRATVLVPDVHQYSDHISCDGRSQSEIVIPVFDAQSRLRAVLDIDSEELATFDAVDQTYLEALAARMKTLQWNELG